MLDLGFGFECSMFDLDVGFRWSIGMFDLDVNLLWGSAGLCCEPGTVPV
jgi:hypothetical protein